MPVLERFGWRVFFLIAFDHRGERVRRLRRAVSGIGQPIEIASQTMKLRSDGLRCHPFGCPTGLGGFPTVVPPRQCWRVFGLVHEPQDSTGCR